MEPLLDLLTAALAQSEAAQPGGASGEGGPSGPQRFASWTLLAAGVVILVWVMLRLQWKRQRRSPDDEPVAQMRETLIDRQAEGQRAAEAAEIVRDLAARLETRAARLEALLDQADERIERLEARLAASTTASHMPRQPQADPRAASHANHADNPSRPAPLDDPWAEPAASGPPAAVDPTGPDPLHREVYDLADDGRTPLDIARRLEQQVGTIELILALRR